MKIQLKTMMKAGDFTAALDLILKIRPSDAIEFIEYAADQLGKIPKDIVATRIPMRKRLAVLGGSTTHFLMPLLRLFALGRGLALDTYESDYGLFEQEIWSEASSLREFAPDVIHFHTSSRNLTVPHHAADPSRIVAEQSSRFLDLYRAAGERFRCALIVNNFETAVERPYGSLDAVDVGTRNGMIRHINELVARNLPTRAYVNDIESLSAAYGKARWVDPRLWNETKLALSLDAHPYYADRLAAMLGALFGKSKKCLVLDLDNTLWGGVIGDDGLSGIKLGVGQPEGEAFVDFQRYVAALKDRGVLLAVASKNEMNNALAPFREHRDMVLREQDIASFVAHWEPKDGSIRTIAQQLNIGLDSIVFFDDNPAERELIANTLPDVTVIDVPADPSGYVRALDEANLFDTLSVTEEDRIRGQFFRENIERQQLVAASGGYDDFLRNLGMRAVSEPVSAANAARVTQLINKTNQFNLTTRRMTEAEVVALIGNADTYTSATRLDDRFGSNGLISVVLGHIELATLTIDAWLMSCRVLKRGVEILEMERLLEFCKNQGVRLIIGHYRPTEKNKLVIDHYPQLGFVKVTDNEDLTTWHFELERNRLELSHFIGVE